MVAQPFVAPKSLRKKWEKDRMMAFINSISISRVALRLGVMA
jgi:hypothetical protein